MAHSRLYRHGVASDDRFPEPIIHLDMDAFFVEVERLRDPSLRSVPVVVGGIGPRGVVASASYEARTFSVRSAMPVARAKRICPGLIIVPPDHAEYRKQSELVFEIIRRFTPEVEGISIDEAFLDVSGLRRHFDDAASVAWTIRRAIRNELDLPSSAGIAVNKLLAKLASQDAKPNGMRLVPADAIDEFLHPLPVRRLWGVGEATYAQLERLGVKTIGDLAGIPVGTLERRIGATFGRHLHQLAHGIDDRPVALGGEAKSVSVEETYDTDIAGWELIGAELLRQAERVAERLRRAGLAGRTVTLKVRFSDFSTITRSRTLPWPTNVGRDIYRMAGYLLERSDIGERPIRLIGIGLSMLEEGGAPHQLATDRPGEWDDLAGAVSEVRDRFGAEALKPARLTRPDHDEG
jgi:DNA polymerase-4